MYDETVEIFNFKPIDFKEIDIQTYTLKIYSKNRNIIREPNPFNFEISFNTDNNKIVSGAVINSKFENIKKISLNQIIIPRYIPRDYIGEPITGITPFYNTSNSISLSYYPGINMNNTLITIKNPTTNLEEQIEVIELVDIINKKTYLCPLEYNNPYYASKYINIKADLFSYLNINNIIYPITKITGNIITLGNTDNYPLPINTNLRLIIADFYKNTLIMDNDGTRIGINNTNIIILKGNILNYQYLFENQYIEYQTNSTNSIITERVLFKISSVTKQLTNLTMGNTIENTTIIINGEWTNGTPSLFDGINTLFDTNNTVKINHFNFGLRDLFEEKIFYLNLDPFVPDKSVSTDPNINNVFGTLYPSTPNSSKDYLYLKGDACEQYKNINLQNTNKKIKFSILDSNYMLIGNVYNKYSYFLKPLSGISILSYLPFNPDLTIILKIDEIQRKIII